MAATSEKPSKVTPPANSADEGGTFFERAKRAVGLAPMGHRVEHDVEEHEGGHDAPAGSAEAGPAVARGAALHEPAAGRSEGQTSGAGAEGPARVEAQKLLKPQEVETGVTKPQDIPEQSGAQAAGSGAARRGAAPASEKGGGSGITTTTTATTTTVTGAGSPQASSPGTTTAPPTPGRRVEGLPAAAASQHKVSEVDARPRAEGEVAPVSPLEAAELKARAHAESAEAHRRRVQSKQRDLEALRQQAKALEQQSAALVAEAERERRRMEEGMQKKQVIEQEEAGRFAKAEKAETERRAVVQRAKPAARTAEEREVEVMTLKQEAADTEFHGQVLENRAKALVAESRELAELSVDKELEAQKVAAQLHIVQQEAGEMKAQIDHEAARGLPNYILECQREIGRLNHRIAQLREEIAWAEGEIERAHNETDTWRRIVVVREGQAAHLRLQLNQLREDAELARQRSKAAAAESLQPADLAGDKYVGAEELRVRAEELESELLGAQREAMEISKEAVGPKQERNRYLREAAEAEQHAKALGAQAEIVAGRVQRREYEAEVKRDMAEHVAEKAEGVREELGAAEQSAEAEQRMTETYREQKEAHEPVEGAKISGF